ncbi:MAG: bacterioferritin-associated ferredoxin [Thiotrichales bacterium]|nr:bacterioferritin-associated ferredoxin [Thiotrichales bacterium]
MYVCLCHGITERDIESAVDDGARSLKDLSGALGVATQCGKCSCHAKKCIRESLASQHERQQMQYVSITVGDMMGASLVSQSL